MNSQVPIWWWNKGCAMALS